MHRPVSVLTVAILAGVSASALAGGYVSLGVGSTAGLGGEIGQHFSDDALGAGRLAIGHRLGPWALEGSFATADLRGQSPFIVAGTTGELAFARRSLAADLKLHFGLLGPIEGYVRGGVHRTWVSAGDGTETMHELAGNGYAVGGGVQLALRFVPGVQAAVFADAGRQVLRLSDAQSMDTGAMEGTADLLMVGVSVGTEL